MIPAGLITFRETLEAVIVVSIVLSILSRSSIGKVMKKFVWAGIAIGIAFSIVLAYFLQSFLGGLSGKTEEMFEGILMFITAGFLTWMIMWVHQQKNTVKNIKEKTAIHVKKGYGFGIFLIVLTSIFREGTETVLYLNAVNSANSSNQLVGAMVGIILALLFGYIIFRLAMHAHLSKVFTVTSVFLLFFAAGMLAHGVHEFQELNILPVFAFDPIFNISNFLDHKSIVGSFLRTLFGYTSKPTLLEIMSYGFYIATIYYFQIKNHEVRAREIPIK